MDKFVKKGKKWLIALDIYVDLKRLHFYYFLGIKTNCIDIYNNFLQTIQNIKKHTCISFKSNEFKK